MVSSDDVADTIDVDDIVMIPRCVPFRSPVD